MKIVEIQLSRLRKLLAERKMQLQLTDAAKKTEQTALGE